MITRRTLLPIITGTLISACTTSRSNSANLTIVRGATPLEREILRRGEGLASINASIGAERIVFVSWAIGLEDIRSAVDARYVSDLIAIYGTELEKAEAEYLLLGERENDYVVFVVRVADTRPDGAYRDLEGLIYAFSKTNLNEPISVRPSHY